MADYGYILLYGYRSKSVTRGLGCCLGCMLTLSVTTAPLRQHKQQSWHYINEAFLTFCLIVISFAPSHLQAPTDNIKQYKLGICTYASAGAWSISVLDRISTVSNQLLKHSYTDEHFNILWPSFIPTLLSFNCNDTIRANIWLFAMWLA